MQGTQLQECLHYRAMLLHYAVFLNSIVGMSSPSAQLWLGGLVWHSTFMNTDGTQTLIIE